MGRYMGSIDRPIAAVSMSISGLDRYFGSRTSWLYRSDGGYKILAKNKIFFLRNLLNIQSPIHTY